MFGFPKYTAESPRQKTSMLEQVKKHLRTLRLRKPKREYNLRVVEYYELDGKTLNEWCLPI